MIHKIFNLTRPLFVLDTEATGTNPETDRIIELGFQQWESTGLRREYRTLINPMRPIPPIVTEITRISDADVQRCQVCHEPLVHPNHHQPLSSDYHVAHIAPIFRQLAPHLTKGLINCDYAGKHVRFDLRLLAAEFKRAGVNWNYMDARIVDIDRLEQIAHPRTLSDLYKKYVGCELEGAHGALVDVQASTEIIVCQLREHATVLPHDLDTLHQLQWPNWIDTEGKFRFVDGVPHVGPWGKHRGVPMAAIPIDYWDFLLKPNSDFSDEVKAIAMRAKLGQFPEWTDGQARTDRTNVVAGGSGTSAGREPSAARPGPCTGTGAESRDGEQGASGTVYDGQ